jgi:hypothetical protein
MAYIPPATDVFPATQNITALDTGTTTTVVFQGQSFITGSPTSASFAVFPLSNITTVNIQVTGTWTGSLRIEASTDNGVTYVSKFSRLPGTAYSGAATITSNASLIAAVSGCTHIRVRSITSWTGTATVQISESANDHLTDVLNPIRLLDSTTNTLMTIKAASTPPAAADTSIVVSESPNSPAATSALQTTGNTSLSTIATNTGASATAVNQTNGTQQTKLTDGITTANVQSIATGQNVLATGGGYKEISGLSAAALNADLLPSTDVSNYAWFSIHITAAASGTLSFQGSNDNFATSIVPIPLNRMSSLLSTPATSTTVSDIYAGPIQYRYIRIRQTAYTSGTSTGVVELYTQPRGVATVGGQFSINGTATINTGSATGSAKPANAFLMGIGDSGGLLQAVASASNTTDGTTGALIVSVHTSAYSGSGFEKTRTATAASNTTGTGLLGVGILGYDGAKYQSVKTSTTGIVSVTDTAATTGGLSIVSASVGGTATVIKASAGQLYGYHFFNTTAAVAYVQIFNVAAASVTLGTTTPTLSIGMPAGSGVTVNFDKGVAFSTAISFACTTTRTGSTGATVDCNFFYA